MIFLSHGWFVGSMLIFRDILSFTPHPPLLQAPPAEDRGSSTTSLPKAKPKNSRICRDWTTPRVEKQNTVVLPRVTALWKTNIWHTSWWFQPLWKILVIFPPEVRVLQKHHYAKHQSRDAKPNPALGSTRCLKSDDELGSGVGASSLT